MASTKLTIEGSGMQPLLATDYQLLLSSARHSIELPSSLLLRFVDTTTMAQINHATSSHNYATDVLSINYAEYTPTLAHELAAEIVICPEVAATNAAHAGQSLADELRMLFVHGLVHIAGHDHAQANDKVRFDSIVSGIIDNTKQS